MHDIPSGALRVVRTALTAISLPIMVVRIGHTSGIRELPHALDIASFVIAFSAVVGAIIISWALHVGALRARVESAARDAYYRGYGDGAQDALDPVSAPPSPLHGSLHDALQ